MRDSQKLVQSRSSVKLANWNRFGRSFSRLFLSSFT